LKRTWGLILLAVFIAFVVIITYVAFRGFEITDEGFYLLMYEKPWLYNSTSRYFIIVSKLFGWMNPQIYHYRLLTIIINLLGSYVFFTGLWQYLKNKFDLTSGLWSKLSAYLFISIGNLAAIFILFRVLGYNDINNFLVLSATGFILLYLGGARSFFLLLAGVLLAFDVMVKFPTGIVYLFLLNIFLFLERKTFEYCKLLFPGILLGLVAYFTFFESPGFFLSSLSSALSKSAGSSHSLKIILDNYSYFIIMAAKSLFKYFSIPLLVFIITLISYRIKKYKYTYILGFFTFYLFITAFLSSMVFAPLSSEGNIHVAMPAFLLLVLFQLIFFLFTKKNYAHKQQLVYIVSFLMLLPFIMAFGSGAPITMMTYLHMAPIFAVFFVLNLLSEAPNFYIKITNIFFSSIFIILCISHLYFLYIQNPFRLNDDLTAQKYSVENVKKLEHLKVDKETKIFLENLNDLMKKAEFKQNDYLIGYLMPGIVYIFDGVSPGATYYDPHEGSKNKNIQALMNSSDILNKTYFLLPEDCKLDICEYIEEKEVLKNHEIVGKVENPYKPNVLFVPNSPLILYKPR